MLNYIIVELDASAASARLLELSDILTNVVEGGASVSFMLPFSQAEAIAYWNTIVSSVADGQTVLLAAIAGDRAIGTVQLGLATPPNQIHRANIAKLLVHRSAQGCGIGRALMQTVEDYARQRGRSLLTLDTITGSIADRLYRSLGYVEIGIIPDYAQMPDGPLSDTTFFYKQLS